MRAGARWYFFEFVAVVFLWSAWSGQGLERISGLTLGLAAAGLAAFQKTDMDSGWRRVLRVLCLLLGVPLVLAGALLLVFAGFLAWRGFTHPDAGIAALAAMVLGPASFVPIVGGGLLVRMGLDADKLRVEPDLHRVLRRITKVTGATGPRPGGSPALGLPVRPEHEDQRQPDGPHEDRDPSEPLDEQGYRRRHEPAAQ